MKEITLDQVRDRIKFIRGMNSWASTDFDKDFLEATRLIDEIMEDLFSGDEHYLYWINKK